MKTKINKKKNLKNKRKENKTNFFKLKIEMNKKHFGCALKCKQVCK